MVIFDDEEERQEHGLRFEGRLHKLVSEKKEQNFSRHVACFLLLKVLPFIVLGLVFLFVRDFFFASGGKILFDS